MWPEMNATRGDEVPACGESCKGAVSGVGLVDLAFLTAALAGALEATLQDDSCPGHDRK
jgi:hypothetical protein